MTTSNRAKGGRPKADIDPDAAERAASIGCTVEEIAAVLGVGRSTFFDRLKTDPALAAALERGREMGRVTLRRLQWATAEGDGRGACTMQIWLGKQMLGQRDKHDIHADVEIDWADRLVKARERARSPKTSG